jgi:glycerophosphoryl diester phosphodiesterase
MFHRLSRPVISFRSLGLLVALLSGLSSCAPATSGDRAVGDDPFAGAPAYARPVAEGARVTPLVTVGQWLPRVARYPDGGYDPSVPSLLFVGRPDGLGLHALDHPSGARRRGAGVVASPGDLRLLVGHEFDAGAGGPAGPLRSGSRITELYLKVDREDETAVPVVSGAAHAVDQVLVGEDSSPPQSSPRIGHLCSASMVTYDAGFDRPVLLIGEEAKPDASFDGRGGQIWAVFEGKACALPSMGRASWENAVVAPFTRERTVVFLLEDGPSSGDGLGSQLYMYVGTKAERSDDALARNGLQGGDVHVFVSDSPTYTSEATFTAKGDSVAGRWRPVDWRLDAVAFDEASRSAGAFSFIRIEDGAADPRNPGVFYFVTTGKGGTANPFGRLYRLDFDPQKPLSGATLTLLLDGSEGIVSPDNIALNRHGELAIQEDPSYDLAELGLHRDSSIWIYRTESGQLERIVEVDRQAAIAHASSVDPRNQMDPSRNHPGSWESSGIIDAERYLGRGHWLFTVQAHGLSIMPAEETVEGGQLLHLVWNPEE